MRSDAKIQKEVIEALDFDPSVAIEHIGVSVLDGIVTLSGSIPSYIEKIAAEKCSLRVAGVKGVVSKIKVNLAKGSVRSDQEIAKAVANVLEWTMFVPTTVHSSVDDGVVTLKGDVEWLYQKKAPEKALENLLGIVEIKNLIRIRSQTKPQEVEWKIREALRRTADEDAKNLIIEVSGKKVVLSGKVHSRAALSDAEWGAWATPGVTSVESRISVLD